MTPGETAAELRVSEKTLANQRSRREGLPYVRIGGAIRYSRRTIAAYIERQTVAPEAVRGQT